MPDFLVDGKVYSSFLFLLMNIIKVAITQEKVEESFQLRNVKVFWSLLIYISLSVKMTVDICNQGHRP